MIEIKKRNQSFPNRIFVDMSSPPTYLVSKHLIQGNIFIFQNPPLEGICKRKK